MTKTILIEGKSGSSTSLTVEVPVNIIPKGEVPSEVVFNYIKANANIEGWETINEVSDTDSSFLILSYSHLKFIPNEELFIAYMENLRNSESIIFSHWEKTSIKDFITALAFFNEYLDDHLMLFKINKQEQTLEAGFKHMRSKKMFFYSVNLWNINIELKNIFGDAYIEGHVDILSEDIEKAYLMSKMKVFNQLFNKINTMKVDETDRSLEAFLKDRNLEIAYELEITNEGFDLVRNFKEKKEFENMTAINYTPSIKYKPFENIVEVVLNGETICKQKLPILNNNSNSYITETIKEHKYYLTPSIFTSLLMLQAEISITTRLLFKNEMSDPTNYKIRMSFEDFDMVKADKHLEYLRVTLQKDARSYVEQELIFDFINVLKNAIEDEIKELVIYVNKEEICFSDLTTNKGDKNEKRD